MTRARKRLSELCLFVTKAMPLFETISTLFQTPGAASSISLNNTGDTSQGVQVNAPPINRRSPSPSPSRGGAMPKIQIDFQGNGFCNMTLVDANGRVAGRYPCGGQLGRSYPKNTILDPRKPGYKEAMHYSREFSNAPMPYSLRIWPQKGIFIHQWDNLSLSHGCIHLYPGDSKKVFDFVKGPTQVLINYPSFWDKMRPAVPEGNAYAKPPEFINIDYSNPSECNRWVTLPNGDRACISKW